MHDFFLPQYKCKPNVPGTMNVVIPRFVTREAARMHVVSRPVV